ncbi:signal recognition particle-docking protein FtsY [Corynebacterium sp. H127]|uniref:signal recognition particle-docking protein FtsY n=1 Tax=Corynebacterium sp. H127 TaxID=3133418 RepID=UPI0030AEF9C4
MNTTYLILGLVVLALLLAVIIMIVLGNKRKKDKTVTFTKEEQPKELTREEKSGNYQAAGGFNFAPAKDKEPELLDGQRLDAVQPQEQQAAASVMPPVPAAQPEPKTATDMVLKKVPAPKPEAEVSEQATAEQTHQVREEETGAEVPAAAAATAATTPLAREVAEEIKDVKDVETPAEPEIAEEAEEAAEAAAVTVDAAEAALEQTPVPDTAPAPAPQPLDEIEPAVGRLGKLRGKLAKSNNFLGQSVLGMLTAGDLDEDSWEEIEDQLIMADLGTATTVKVVESLREKIAARGVETEEQAKAMLRETLIEVGKPELDRSIKAMPYEGKPAVVLVVGVNGTGKTTTTGKLARVLVSMGHKVLLGAADTFRAAAADQLETWGRRVGAETVRGAEGADPASVAFDAVAKGVETQADVVLIDTAGRLHTSVGLMDQLGKVKRVVEKKAKVDEVLLVLDATVGQNGLMQARTFRDVVDITGVVLTKLDGTAKGGIVFQVQEELGVPVKLVGLGEGADHLAPFEVESFVDALLA